MDKTQVLILVFLSAIGINIILIRKIKIFRETETYQKGNSRFIKLLKWEEGKILSAKKNIGHWISTVKIDREQMGLIAEILLIGVWSFWIGQEYLDFNPQTWPIGREVGVQIAPHNFWNQIQECGICALWNGSINGGSPALADPFSAAFHPLVMITTSILGIVNGVKLATLLSLWVAGIAQWGIAYLFNGRRFIRVWSGALAVAGGHILGKLELGAFGIALSTSMATVTIFCLLYFLKKRNNRSMILLALSITLLLFSSHGYLQVGILTWLLLIFLLLFINQPGSDKKKLFVALILGILMASIIIIPILHFAPNLQKWSDLEGKLTQDLEYIPLNLIIRDPNYYRTEILSKTPFPYLSNIYIGWIPVILAVLCLSFNKDEHKSSLISLSSLIFLSLFLASGIPFQWVGKIIPFVQGIRHTQLIAGLMVPPIIGIASFSLEKLFSLDWPAINLSPSSGKSVLSLPVQWLLLIPILFSIYTCYDFNKEFIQVENRSKTYQIIQSIDVNSSQWIAPPFGFHWWVLPAIENDLKITGVDYPWWLKGRENPPPYMTVTIDDPTGGTDPDNNLSTNIYASVHYAFIDTGTSQIPCHASVNGGHIEVYCDTDFSGRLIVRENRFIGWKVWRDGIETRTYGEQWLTVEAPEGKHIYIFRYLPWDVLVGFIISLIGLFLSIAIWFSLSERIDLFLEK